MPFSMLTRSRRDLLGACAAALFATGLIASASAESLDDASDEVMPQVFDGPVDLSTPMPGADRLMPAVPSRTSAAPAPAASAWDTRLGVDRRAPAAPWLARPASIATQEPPDGAAWAKFTAPGFETPWSWDKASFETRVDPLSQQRQVATRLSRSVPVGSNVAVTIEGSYSFMQSVTGPAVGAPPATAAPISTSIWGTDRRLQVDFLPSATTLTVGAASSSTDQKSLYTLSAEQKLFGSPLTITGTLTETPNGDYAKSLKAGFTRTW
jgi:hypothetical protein